MVFKIIIEPEAEKEIEQAIDWYESQQKGLGLDFLNYLDGYFKTLQNGHVSFEIKRLPVFRELPLMRFPFVIIYEQTKTKIFIYSVFNTNQDPVKKKK